MKNPYAYYIIDKHGRTRLVKRKRNPGLTNTVGNMIGGLGLIAVPVFIGLLVWLNRRYA